MFIKCLRCVRHWGSGVKQRAEVPALAEIVGEISLDWINAVRKIRTQTENAWGASWRRQPLSQDLNGRKV